MDLTIAHELSHSLGEKHEGEVTLAEFEKNIWKSCFK
jgi:hypothetical protein